MSPATLAPSTAPAPRSRSAHALRAGTVHLLLSATVAGLVALLVFGAWFPGQLRALSGGAELFWLLVGVDVVCGPLLTLVLASPSKSPRERWLDFSLVGLVQVAALLYGLHSLWAARPVVLAFEVDRLVIASANEVQTEALSQAPAELRSLPWWGVLQVGTRKAKDSNEFFESMNLGLGGISPAMRPHWWLPWDSAQAGIQERAKPVAELLARRPQAASVLQAAMAETGLPVQQLRYLPLTSSKTKDWVALLNTEGRIVGYAPVDGF